MRDRAVKPTIYLAVIDLAEAGMDEANEAYEHGDYTPAWQRILMTRTKS
jgi:hypothetical protein